MGTDDLNKTIALLYDMEKLAYDDAFFVPLTGEYFITAEQPYVKGAVWFWGGTPYPILERAWLDK